MDRKSFLKVSFSGATYFLSGGLSGIHTACKKKDKQTMKVFTLVKSGNFDSPLRKLPVVDTSGTVYLTSSDNKSSVIPGKTTVTSGYWDQLLAPIIRVNRGQTVTINFRNQLEEETNIHWHGLIIPETMDGHPRHVIQPGQAFSYRFTIDQRAGTNWFHPHPHLKTGRQVHKGLAGLFIVNDAEEAALNLPSGDLEIPLIIQDKRIYTDGSLNYSPDAEDVMNGYFGQYICVNGCWSPFVAVQTRMYRLRLLNGSNARAYQFSLSNGDDFHLIGSDGGLLSHPYRIRQLLLSPGERADVLVDFGTVAAGQEIYLQSDAFDGAGSQGKQSFRILKFVVADQVTDPFTLPTVLGNVAPLLESQAVKTRSFDITNAHTAGHGGMDMGNSASIHKIGGKSFEMERVDETVEGGAVEIWEFDNSQGADLHPMHLHGVHFQVLSRTGGRNTVQPHETGWKDTVLCMPGERVKIIMKFPRNPGVFAFHCHNLEHEDSGMMLNYKII